MLNGRCDSANIHHENRMTAPLVVLLDLLATDDPRLDHAALGAISFLVVNALAVGSGFLLGKLARVTLTSQSGEGSLLRTSVLPLGIGIVTYFVVNTLLLILLRAIVAAID